MSEINENSGNVNNLVPEESKAPVLNEPVTETIDNKVTDPQEPEITEPEKTKPEKQPGVIPAEKQDEQKPSGENKGDQKPRWQNKRERPKGDTIYSDARSIAVKILTRVELRIHISISLSIMKFAPTCLMITINLCLMKYATVLSAG